MGPYLKRIHYPKVKGEVTKLIYSCINSGEKILFTVEIKSNSQTSSSVKLLIFKF